MFLQTIPIVAALLSMAASHTRDAPQTPPSSPTPRAIVDELNLLRSNPSGYADILEARLPYYNGNRYMEPGKAPVRAIEGRRPVEETIAILRSLQPLPALQLADDMSRAAQDHANDQERTGAAGHISSNGWDFVERTAPYGELIYPAGEAISYGPATAREIIVALVVDDGVADRGHRHSLLDPDYRVAGIGYAPHTRYRITCVIDLAAGYAGRSELH